MFGLALLLIACSNRQVYTAVQQNQQLQCSKLPQDRYEECVREIDESYDDYEREREELLRNEK
jgi:hypothetical protein